MFYRKQLVLYFVSIVLVVLILFAWNAYRIAYSSMIEEQAKMIRDFSISLSGNLSNAYLASHTTKEFLKVLSDNKINDHYVTIVTNRDGKPVIPDHINQIFEMNINQLSENGLLNPNIESGHTSRNGQHYIWVHIPIPNTPYNLLHVFKAGISTQDPVSHLATGLIAIAIIILWFAVWGALILAHRISNIFEKQSAKLEYHINHDSLTGLPNRSLLNNHIQSKIDEAKVSGKHIALIMVDLDRFKEINDTLGHENGDALLKEVSVALKNVLWESDMLARMGGDEFALLLPISSASHCSIVANKAQKALSEPFMLGGMTLEIRASLGVAIYPENAKDAGELIRCAEVAMYIAKSTGEHSVYYNVENDPHSIKRLKLASDLWVAAERGEFTLFYQPKMNIRSHEIVGVEALIRWSHPEYGLVPPDEFIPLAEQSGAIKSITDWVIDQAVRQCVHWRNKDINLSVSVNLSVRSLHDVSFSKTVARTLKKHGLESSRLELEITETAIMMDPERAFDILQEFSDKGIKLSIDDFGTGYTSLAHLKRLPVDEIKIDKSFVMDMLEDFNNAVIVQSIISLSNSMGRTVIAEGVESSEIIDELSKMGCDNIQGYFISRPLSEEDFEQWLGEHVVFAESQLQYVMR